jgi:hydroxylamine reductase
MKMFCYQCQETAGNNGCTNRGVCGKDDTTACLQDLLIATLKGIGVYYKVVKGEKNLADFSLGSFTAEELFSTITNADYDPEDFRARIREALKMREKIQSLCDNLPEDLPREAAWNNVPEEKWPALGLELGVLQEEDEDIRSLKELVMYGLKGMAAYLHHADVLGYQDESLWDFLLSTLGDLTEDSGKDDLIGLVLKTGEKAVAAMELLDRANTETYGSPEITEVNLGVGENPGILISGHDLKDMEELLKQTEGTGVDVYTHGEMLPAHYYPAFKKYDHFVGNYGGSWWKQNTEFDSFNGPILMTTNCITPVKDAYKDRIFTTGVTGYPEVPHITDREAGGTKDFSEVIAKAKTCAPPEELEKGTIVGGFAREQVLALADKVVDAVKSGAIKRFVVMAGCDGRQMGREYFTEVAETLPEGTVILTAGCAKYRYNKLQLGDINGIPRVLDAGQCNDSYSLAVIALTLKKVFELEDINDLPISFDIAWYEQKAVTVLLALLHLGIKGIRLGPTLPAFLSPGVTSVLGENFDIKPTDDVQKDVDAMMAGA